MEQLTWVVTTAAPATAEAWLAEVLAERDMPQDELVRRWPWLIAVQ